MPGSKAINEQIEELIAQAPELSKSSAGQGQDEVFRQMAWLIAAQSAVPAAPIKQPPLSAIIR